MYVSLQAWSKEVRKALVEKEVNLQTVAEEIGCGYNMVTSLVSGRIVKGNYLDIARKINEVLGIEDEPDKPPLPSEEWAGSVRYAMFVRKINITQLSKLVGFTRDRLSLVLNCHSMDIPVIDKINEVLEIKVPVISQVPVK